MVISGSWGVQIDAAETADYSFFKVTVEMK